MRDREVIAKSGAIKNDLLLEVLLDIRELLMSKERDEEKVLILPTMEELLNKERMTEEAMETSAPMVVKSDQPPRPPKHKRKILEPPKRIKRRKVKK